MASKRKEKAAIDELRGSHSYLLFELRRRDERLTMIATRRGGKLSTRAAVALKLVVPEDSVLGREVIAARKATAKAKRR